MKFRIRIKNLAIGFLILIMIQFISNCLVKELHIPFPSPLLGMVILSLLLYFEVIPKKTIKNISNLLLKNMALFFIPLFVGIISYSQLIKENLFPIILTIVFTTFFTMLVTALGVEYIIKITDHSTPINKEELE